MRKFHVYDLYMDDNHNCFKVTVPAESKKAAIDYATGNGDVIAVKPCPLQDIDIECLADTLRRCAWGQKEIDVITRTLVAVGLDRTK